MNAKYKNKYRVPSARAQWWDYGRAGAYFITICTEGRRHYFGAISADGTQQLSHIGIIADVFWHEIPHHARRVELGAFVVMPNHVHGILILHHEDNIGDVNKMEVKDAVETPPLIDPFVVKNNPEKLYDAHYRFQNQGKNTISSIVGSYKSAVTKHSRRLGLDFSWQVRFHDYIIRNDGEYQRINDYIEGNPANWAEDKFYFLG